jgi:hypothetical protein
MRLRYHCTWSMPVDWPKNHKDLTELVEDGDEETLHVEYEDRAFRRPMAPWKPEDVRKAYGVKGVSHD